MQADQSQAQYRFADSLRSLSAFSEAQCKVVQLRQDGKIIDSGALRIISEDADGAHFAIGGSLCHSSEVQFIDQPLGAPATIQVGRIGPTAPRNEAGDDADERPSWCKVIA